MTKDNAFGKIEIHNLQNILYNNILCTLHVKVHVDHTNSFEQVTKQVFRKTKGHVKCKYNSLKELLF